jgi:hypothetical protein
MYSDRMDLIRVLKKDLGEPGTEAMIRYWDLTLKENNESMCDTLFNTLATKKELGEIRKELGEFKYEFIQFRGDVKEEFANVRGEMKEGFANVRSEMKEGFANVRGEMKEGLAKVKGELEVKISDTKSDVVRWMFAFFVTMLLAIIGLYFKK